MIQHIIFYTFSTLLLAAATMVITSRNTVRGVLSLVLCFFASSVLWMLLQAEFLSLVLIFVYVGAVMTLFLFVVMMLNIHTASKRERFMRYLPFGLLIIIALAAIMLFVEHAGYFGSQRFVIAQHGSNYSNVSAIGEVLYTRYMYPFEIAAVLLLVAIISAIGLAFRGRQNSKTQSIAKQHAARKQDCITLIDLKSKKT